MQKVAIPRPPWLKVRLADWEAYVREQEGDGERVYRIYPADFWVR